MAPFRARTPPVEVQAAGMRTASAAAARDTPAAGTSPGNQSPGSQSPGTSGRQLPDTAEAAVAPRMRSFGATAWRDSAGLF